MTSLTYNGIDFGFKIRILRVVLEGRVTTVK